MTKFKLTCYPESNCECKLTIEIGKMSEIQPNDKNYDPELSFGYSITVDDKKSRILGITHHGFKSRMKAQASAMLRAVSYGNGGFPLEDMLR